MAKKEESDNPAETSGVLTGEAKKRASGIQEKKNPKGEIRSLSSLNSALRVSATLN